MSTGRSTLLVALLLLMVCFGASPWAWPVQAAVRIDYFQTFTIGNLLRLEWKTAEENDLAAFQIYCKEEAEPNSAYHLIGTRWAQGNADEGAVYTFDIAEGIEPGVSYCFRLEELTIDNRRGDILDFCGYGLNISPAELLPTLEILPTATTTPTLTATATLTATITGTALTTITATASATVPETIVINTPVPLATEAASPTVTPTFATPSVDATATPTGTITNTVTDTVTDTVIVVIPTATLAATLAATPTLTVTSTRVDAVSTDPDDSSGETRDENSDENSGIVVIPTEMATVTPAGPGQTALITATQTAAAGVNQNSPLPTATATITGSLSTTTVGTADLLSPSVESGSTMATSSAEVAPVPPYIVLTATPRGRQPEQTPTFTPFPTMIAVAEGNLLATTMPTSQNLMLLLLCGIFSGASGLGILGVVTTLLYMRSRRAEERNSRHR